MNIPNLRSPYAETEGLVYFARMVDKARIHAKGELPADYVANLGTGFDGRCASFLRIDYAKLVEQVHTGADDATLLQWAFANGRRPEREEIEVWNEFMRKRGWNDDGTERLNLRKRESGFEGRADIQTFFDYIDADEGRAPRPIL